MRRRRERGYSLLEVAVSLAVFGTFIAIFFILTAEMRRWEKRLPTSFLQNPQIISVIARLRRDVLDAQAPPGAPLYRFEYAGFTNNDKTLIFDSLQRNGTIVTIVWDFSEPGVARRFAYTGGEQVSGWAVRGLPPDFSKSVDLDAVEFEDRPYGVRITARNSNGQIAIDQILQPRAHD